MSGAKRFRWDAPLNIYAVVYAFTYIGPHMVKLCSLIDYRDVPGGGMDMTVEDLWDYKYWTHKTYNLFVCNSIYT